jgi:hypothetical protein
MPRCLVKRLLIDSVAIQLRDNNLGLEKDFS